MKSYAHAMGSRRILDAASSLPVKGVPVCNFNNASKVLGIGTVRLNISAAGTCLVRQP